MSSNKKAPARGWIGFGRNYFHNLGVERWHDLPLDSHKDELYSWGIPEQQQDENDDNAATTTTDPQPQAQAQAPASLPLEAYYFAKEIPAKRKSKKGKEEKQLGQQLAPAACSSAASFFLSGSRHNRIMTLGTIHGHIMSPTLEENQARSSSSSNKPASWSPFSMVSPSTVTIPLPLPCVELAAGRHFCLARLEGGMAVCSWGAGHFGQLGHGTTSFRSNNEEDAAAVNDSDNTSTSTYQATPKVIERLLPRMVGSPVVQVAAGDWHAMALAQDGTVLAWGCNRNMQCGRKSTRTNKNPNAAAAAPLQMIPMPVTILDTDPGRADDPPVQIAKITCGKAHSVAISKTSKVYCWGASHYGQCASNTSGAGAVRTSKYTRNVTTLPKLVAALQDCHIVDVAAGDRHTLALTQGGRVFSWGAGSEGQLGIYPPLVCTPKPRMIQDLDFVAITASEMQGHARALAAADPSNSKNQNNATIKAQFETEAANTLASVPTITSISAAGCSSYALSSNGHVYAWGSNDARNLGLPIPPKNRLTYWEVGMPPAVPNGQRLLQVRTFDSDHNVLLPRRIEALDNVHVEELMTGPSHCWFLGETRPDANAAGKKKVPVVVGRTLFEVEQMRKQQGGMSNGASAGGGNGQLLGSIHESASWADSAATSDWGGSSFTPTSTTLGRQLVSHSSTMATDEEDDNNNNTTTVDLMSASMPCLSYDEQVAAGGPNNAASSNSRRRPRYGRHHSESELAGSVAPPKPRHHFSVSGILKKLGVSSRKNSPASTATDERSLDRSNNDNGIDAKMSGGSGHSGKKRFPFR